jgi:hypothetical protein
MPNSRLLSLDLEDFYLEAGLPEVDLKVIQGKRQEGQYKELAAWARLKAKRAFKEFLDGDVSDPFTLAVKKEMARYTAAWVRFLEKGQEGGVSE